MAIQGTKSRTLTRFKCMNLLPSKTNWTKVPLAASILLQADRAGFCCFECEGEPLKKLYQSLVDVTSFTTICRLEYYTLY